MNSKMTWNEWVQLFKEKGIVIVNDDVHRKLAKEGRIRELITQEEAKRLLACSKVKIYRKHGE